MYNTTRVIWFVLNIDLCLRNEPKIRLLRFDTHPYIESGKK